MPSEGIKAKCVLERPNRGPKTLPSGGEDYENKEDWLKERD